MITSLQFYLIVVPTLIVYWLLPSKYKIRQVILILSSSLFLYLFDKSALVITILLSIYSYAFGYYLLKRQKKNILHIIAIAGLILCLVFFKYTGLFTSTINALSCFISILPKFEIKNILLPLGLSYIVLKHISYLTDIKWGIIKETNFIDFLSYSTLFTIFTAGPIERFERYQPQIRNTGLDFQWDFIDKGFQRIVFGLFKKLVLADGIAFIINPIWANKSEYTIEIQALALLGFSFQIYFDFSGYSDIAIGATGLFGIKIIENFDFPYLKRNISQFWRGWHISLSDWIRDYIFMPLIKISNKKVWIYFGVPVISMGLCGLWHGGKIGFLLWGIWHGVGLSLYQIFIYFEKRNKFISKNSKIVLAKPISITVTFIYVTIGWLWFI